jgi:hypothetical protein
MGNNIARTNVRVRNLTPLADLDLNVSDRALDVDQSSYCEGRDMH